MIPTSRYEAISVSMLRTIFLFALAPTLLLAFQTNVAPPRRKSTALTIRKPWCTSAFALKQCATDRAQSLGSQCRQSRQKIVATMMDDPSMDGTELADESGLDMADLPSDSSWDRVEDSRKEASKQFWLELVNQKMALKNIGDQAAEKLQRTVVKPAGTHFTAEEAKEIVSEARHGLETEFNEIDSRTQRTLKRVLDAFRKNKVGPHLFGGTDGYGHGDFGRDTLDQIYAELFGAEQALVRVQCFSGTHAIACALFSVLRPGDEMLAISGHPYDTLEEVIGLRKEDPELRERGMTGSLMDFGVSYREVPLTDSGDFDRAAILAALRPNTRLIHIQRSCGYQWRPSIPVTKIGDVISWIKQIRPDVVVFVDNCYGEFVEDIEPTHVGADLVAGSLIKNPGGTLVPSGGYIIGRSKYVRAARNRLSAPGVDGGATLGKTRLLYQGLFNAPNVVGEALKGTRLVAEVLGRLGYESNPPPGVAKTDIICAVRLETRENLLAFCRAVQRNSPVGSYIIPEAGTTVGYGDEVVFADGTFIDGSTLELSADGPLREPFVAYAQGGTHWTHWAIVLEDALQGMTARLPVAGSSVDA